MRFTASIAALALAGVAWIACWQEVQLLRLKRQIRPDVVAAATAVPRAEVSPEAAPSPVQTGASSLDQLRALLVEREEAIADARDAAAEFGIAEGSPDMDRAILLATRDLDRAIIKLAGPAAASQLTLSVPRAALPAKVEVAPIAVSPLPAIVPLPPTPAPSYTIAPATNVYISVAAPAPAYPEPAPAAATDPALAAYAAQPIIYGGLGASFGGRTSREEGRGMSQSEKLKYFAASAGIPLSGSPLGAVATTSPLLLSRQRSAAAAAGR